MKKKLVGDSPNIEIFNNDFIFHIDMYTMTPRHSVFKRVVIEILEKTRKREHYRKIVHYID